MLPALVLLAALAAPAGPPRTVTAVVTDAQGAPVAGLTASDVALLENGAAREILAFEADVRPLSLAVVVDTSEPSRTAFRLQVVEPLIAFLKSLPAGTRYSVWTTGDRPTKVIDLTDRAAAADALKRVFPRGGNILLDTIVEAGKELGTREGERAAMVVITGLGPGFTSYDRRAVVDRVGKQAITFHGITFDEGRTAPGAEQGQDGGSGALDYEYVIGELADRTGGLRESLLSAMAVGRTLDAVKGRLGPSYRVTYSAATEKDGKLELTVARPGATARVLGGKR